MKIQRKYIAHDPEVQERLESVLDRASFKTKTRFKNEMLFFDVERYIYYLEVWIETEKIEHLVKNNQLRGKDYHLDHIIPLSYGYTYNIPFEIIGSFFNLQVIPAKENLMKGREITEQAEELLSKIEYDGKFYPKPTKIVYDTSNIYMNYRWEDRELLYNSDYEKY